MVLVAWRQLRARRARSAALLAGLVFAITGFDILTANVAASHLAVTGEVSANVRDAYDILVRPVAARSQAEVTGNLVRPNQLTGQYGGITEAQWQKIGRLPGVEVAAPVATLGYAAAVAHVHIDVTDSVDPKLASQVIRIRPTWRGDSGLTSATETTPRFVYVTRDQVAAAQQMGVSTPGQQPGYQAPDGTIIPAAELVALGCEGWQVPRLYLEKQHGHWKPICGTWALSGTTVAGGKGVTGLSLNQAEFHVFQELSAGNYLDFSNVALPPDPTAGTTDQPAHTARVTFTLDWPLWMPMAAVDPGAEARLVGLDKAVISGSYLQEKASTSGDPPHRVNFLMPSTLSLAEELNVVSDRVSGIAVVGSGPKHLLDTLSSAAGASPHAHEFQAGHVYQDLLDSTPDAVRLDVTLQASQPTYVSSGPSLLTPNQVPVTAQSWSSAMSRFGERATGAQAFEPYLANDIGFRLLGPSAVTPILNVSQAPTAVGVGVFDVAKLSAFSALSAVPLDTYQVSPVIGADSRTRGLLGNRPLMPTSNPAGYLSSPPLLLIALSQADGLISRTDPISAIRVRVKGVSGVDPVSRERVRLVAQEITDATGLAVDITAGSSPVSERIHLPAGKFGRPEMLLQEMWTKKGIALRIVQAADRKSLALSALVLVVCALFLVNGIAAAVRERRRELAILACLGWGTWGRAKLVAAEVGILGTMAGLISVGVSRPAAWIMGVQMTNGRALQAVPAAVALALLAGLVPAIGAGRVPAAEAIQRRAGSVASRRPRRTLPGLAAANLARNKGRTVAAVAAVSVSVAAIVLLLSIMWAFEGVVVGSLLGNAVSLRARPIDVIGVATTSVLGILAVADIIDINIRERRNEFALLRACGWSQQNLGRLVGYEAVGVGLLGGLTGAAAGLAGVGWLTGSTPAVAVAVAAAAGVAAVVTVGVAAALPISMLSRLPTAAALAEE